MQLRYSQDVLKMNVFRFTIHVSVHQIPLSLQLGGGGGGPPGGHKVVTVEAPTSGFLIYATPF